MLHLVEVIVAHVIFDEVRNGMFGIRTVQKCITHLNLTILKLVPGHFEDGERENII